MAMTIPQNKPEIQWATPSNSLVRYSKDDGFHLFYTIFTFSVERIGKMEWSRGKEPTEAVQRVLEICVWFHRLAAEWPWASPSVAASTEQAIRSVLPTFLGEGRSMQSTYLVNCKVVAVVGLVVGVLIKKKKKRKERTKKRKRWRP